LINYGAAEAMGKLPPEMRKDRVQQSILLYAAVTARSCDRVF